MRSLVAGIILGVAIAVIWRNLNKPKPPTPPKGAKTQRLHDTRELAEIRQQLERAG